MKEQKLKKCIEKVSKSKKIDENGVPGPIRAQGTEKNPKVVWIWSGFALDLAPFRLNFETFVEVFVDVFSGRFFFSTGTPCRCPRVQK